MKIYSPLRYPGGKNKLADFIAKICVDNKVDGHYIEPYAGGASVALFLLFNNIVNRITINDNDRSIYAFWYSVLNYTDKLCKLTQNTDVTIANWLIQRDIQKNKKTADLLTLGFSTLFLNRTNISGILNGGVMGGLEQKGLYKIDCRFNKKEIVSRIQNISKKKNHIRLYKKDALKLIEKIKKESTNGDTIFYFDPPYFIKGSSLYMNYYKKDDHFAVCDKIKEITNVHWIVSYDNVKEIKKLYSIYRSKEYTFKHTAHSSKIGKEILFFSNDLRITNPINYNPINYKMISQSNIIYKS
ncbi:MAG: DNA adenine methylase [Bacteroidetes bacterium]|nr:DNA adenine methylase [Bacteroidota bacterium]